MNQIKISVINFYPEEIRTKKDAAQYHAKGTCEVSIMVNGLEFDIRNITYRIERNGKIHFKPPFRIYSNKKDGIKPKLVPSIVFRDPEIWIRIHGCIREEIERIKPEPKNLKSPVQLDFFKANEQKIA